MNGFAVGLASDAVDEDEVFEGLADFAMMHELEAVDIGHAVAEAASELDHFGEVGVRIWVVDASIFEILNHEFVRFHNHTTADGFAGELVGDMFELIIYCAVDLRDGVVKKRKRRFREDDCGNALGVALGIVAELGDLLFSVDFGEFIIMKLGVATLGVREDTDRGEELVQAFERAKRNRPIFGNGVVVGVDFDGIAPMNAVGDGHGKEEDGMAGEFRKSGSGVKKEEMMIIELFELHDFRFDDALAVAQGLTSGAKIGFCGGVSAVAEFLNYFLELMEIEVGVFFDVLRLD